MKPLEEMSDDELADKLFDVAQQFKPEDLDNIREITWDEALVLSEKDQAVVEKMVLRNATDQNTFAPYMIVKLDNEDIVKVPLVVQQECPAENEDGLHS